MRRPLIAIASLLAASLACAQGVYKWTDAQGTVHYSETPPANGKYSRVDVSTDTSASSTPAPATSGAATAPAAASNAQPAKSVPNTPQNRDQVCATLRTNLTALRGSAPVVTNGADGQPTVLSPDQRKSQLDSNNTQYNQYCGNNQ